ncbi:MAG: PaaI family thioesterase [Rhodobiaceae bacterium]|nr:PaaI family thioesterase [Rhodobiaceae bacterium]
MSDTSAPTLEESFPIPGSEEEPNSLRMLGWKLLDWDPEAQQIKVGFETRKEFRNPGGVIQGGIIAAMIDDAFGPMCIMASGRTKRPLTLDLNVSYLAAGNHGKFTCEARIIRQGKSISFVEGELFDASGELVARATSTVRLVPMQPR